MPAEGAVRGLGAFSQSCRAKPAAGIRAGCCEPCAVCRAKHGVGVGVGASGAPYAGADTGQLLRATSGPADWQGPWAGFGAPHVSCSCREPQPLFFVLSCSSMRQKCKFLKQSGAQKQASGLFGKAGEAGRSFHFLCLLWEEPQIEGVSLSTELCQPGEWVM